MQKEVKEGKQEVQRLKAALVEQEAAVLQRDRQLTDLRKQLKDALRQAEPPMQRDQAVQSMLAHQQDQQTQVSCLDVTGMSSCFPNFVWGAHQRVVIYGGCQNHLHVLLSYASGFA